MQSKHQQETKAPRLSASDETKYCRKYKDLKKRIRDIEEDNDRLTVKLQRLKKNITRLRVERSFLFEKLESAQQGNSGNPELMEYGHSSGEEGGSPRRLSMVDGQRVKTSEKKSKFNISGPHDLTPSSSSGRGGRKPKTDPNAPKRPANAFFVYCNLMRQQIKEENADASLSDLTRLLGQKWKSLAKDEQKKYYELYKKDKERYATEMTAYNGVPPISSCGEHDDFDTPRPLGLEGRDFREEEEEEVTMEHDEGSYEDHSRIPNNGDSISSKKEKAPSSNTESARDPSTREDDDVDEEGEEEEEDVAMGSDDEDL